MSKGETTRADRLQHFAREWAALTEGELRVLWTLAEHGSSMAAPLLRERAEERLHRPDAYSEILRQLARTGRVEVGRVEDRESGAGVTIVSLAPWIDAAMHAGLLAGVEEWQRHH